MISAPDLEANPPDRRALITGITGQDGSYLTELLLSKNYEVHGLVRRASTMNTSRIDHLVGRRSDGCGELFLHHGDLSEATRLTSLIDRIAPHEVYNLASQSDVQVSFEQPEYTAETTATGVTRILEAIRTTCRYARFYQASSSEIFGSSPPPQDEATAFCPRSPYAAAKLYAFWMTRNYREAHGIFAVNGILFNHESPRRGRTFVTRKIAAAAARIALGIDQYVHLGNLDAIRDWGYAPEYVEGMWRMLQHDRPDDYVLATGTACTVREFADHCFRHVGLDYRAHVRFDESFLRPTEVDSLIGDASKAHEVLDWNARTLPPQLAEIMVDAEVTALSGGVGENLGTGFMNDV